MKQPPPISEERLREVLQTAGTKAAAAKELGISRPTLDAWIEHYGIPVSTKRLQLA